MSIFLPRQEIFAPVGLVTQPSKYGQYPSGACAVARNFTLRNPGELVQAPSTQDTVSLSTANSLIHKLMPLDTGHVYSLHTVGSTWSVRESGSSAAFPGSTTGAFSSTGRISWARVAERMVVNGSFGCLVGDKMAPANSTERALREAGLPQPTFSGIGIVEDGLGWLAEGQMVGYTACFVRTFADGYELRSSPSAFLKVLKNPASSGTAPFNIQATVRWPYNPSSTLIAGDKIEVYRTDTLATTNPTADPGATYKRVLTYTLVALDIASTQATLVDRQPTIPGSAVCPGQELYSNPGQEGENYSNRRPPIAKCIESFKGFAFYGHTTERAQFTFSVAGGVGSLDQIDSNTGTTQDAFRAHGIGKRGGVGTVTPASAVITGVSADEIVGIVPGQLWNSASGFNALVDRVISVNSGAGTITMSAPAAGAAAGFILVDVIEIDGTIRTIEDIYSLAYSSFGDYEVTCSLSIPAQAPYFMLAFEVTFERNAHPLDASITVRATNGDNYSPPLPEITETVKTFTTLTRKNRIQWSKEQQPEHAPSVSEDFVGFGELYATNTTRDALWHWCSDGLFRLSGNGGSLGLGSWQLDYANSTLLLAGPQASTVMNEFLYAYTNIGFVEVDSAGSVINLTDKIIGDLLPGQKYTESRKIVVQANETDDEVILILGDNGSDSSDTVYVFNTAQRGWTTLGSNGSSLSSITALAMQRSPTSGEPRLLFGVSPLSGVAGSYSGWNSTSSFLTAEVRYQPIYGDDPLETKRWLWADYLFDTGSDGKTFVPKWNGTQYGGTVSIQRLDEGCYARAGCPREVGLSQSISPGFGSLSSTPQSRFQGISVPLKQRTNQSKKR